MEKNDEPVKVVITGPWNKYRFTPKLEDDLDIIVNKFVDNNAVIVTGLALGVDMVANEIAISRGNHVIGYAPKGMYDYLEHIGHSWHDRGKLSLKDARAIGSQIRQISQCNECKIYENLENINSLSDSGIHQNDYYDRIERMVNDVDMTMAFHVDDTGGVGYTIRRTVDKGKPCLVLRYEKDKKGWAEDNFSSVYNLRSIEKNKKINDFILNSKLESYFPELNKLN